jgi:hypothetical protein
MPTLEGEMELTSWNEDAYAEREGGRKLTQATVTQRVSGGVTGSAEVRWLMSYREDGTARFLGLQVLDGTIEGRAGSAVIESVGEFDGQMASGTLTVVSGSGTGAWSDLQGKGRFEAPMGPKATFSLDYAFAAAD